MEVAMTHTAIRHMLSALAAAAFALSLTLLPTTSMLAGTAQTESAADDLEAIADKQEANLMKTKKKPRITGPK
jgi:hypothetical protein